MYSTLPSTPFPNIPITSFTQGPILIGGVEENSTFDRAARAGQKEKLKEAGWGDRGVGSIPTPANDPITVNRHGIVPLN